MNSKKTKKIIFLILVSLILILNTISNHIQLDSNSERTSLKYYIKSGITPEFLIAITSYYPVLICILIFFKIPPALYLILGILGLGFTILLWILMHLHFDVNIVSFNFAYYTILGMEFIFSVFCFTICFRKNNIKYCN
jgi:hypothetical protein